MPTDLLLGLATFAAVTCFTPGPNNAMLMASGLNFGVERTVPHILGVALGFAFMVLMVALGIGSVLEAWPVLYSAMRIAAIAYLLWLAWGIATAHGARDGEVGSRPLSFLQACLFQWINPKGWIMALGATASYAIVASPVRSATIMAAVFGALGFLSSLTWAFCGAGLRRLLDRPGLVRIVNMILALLLVASLLPVMAEVQADLSWW